MRKRVAGAFAVAALGAGVLFFTLESSPVGAATHFTTIVLADYKNPTNNVPEVVGGSVGTIGGPDGCVTGRKISIVNGGVTIATVRTNSVGNWALPLTGEEAGGATADVAKKTIGSGAHAKVCDAAVSSTILVA